MRIGIVSVMVGWAWGGSEELWFEMALEARRAGHEVGVALCRPYEASEPLNALRAAGVELLAPPRMPGPGKANRAGHAVLDLFTDRFRSVMRWRPDVLCISQGSSYDLAMHSTLHPLGKLLSERSIPYVIVCQANDDHIVLQPETVRRLTPILVKAARLAYVADRNRTVAERQVARALPQAVVVRNPVNLADRSPVAWPAEATPARLAVVARLMAAVKGQDALLEALALLRWPAEQWRLDFFGQGSDQPHLAALAGFYGLASNVTFRGQISDIRALWAEQHLLVLPSRMEGTPLALVEAMLCGRPAVVSDVGGNAEWISEARTGFIAEAPTARSLAGALQRAWEARGRWQEMGMAAHREASGLYDPAPGHTLLSIVVGAAGAAPSQSVG